MSTGGGVSRQVAQAVRMQANNRCGYCLARQEYLPWPLKIEHIIPISKGGTNDESNLWLACRSCNLYKSNRVQARDPRSGRLVRLFNPRLQVWTRHFRWSQDGVFIVGLTACGRVTVVALNLNSLVAVTVRRNWIAAGWHPPEVSN
jgi:hypothetical protein